MSSRQRALVYHKHKYELEEQEKPEWMTDASDKLETVWGWSASHTKDQRFGFETREEAIQDAKTEGYIPYGEDSSSS